MTLAYVKELRRAGRPKKLAGWQIDMRTAWLDMSQCDEQWLISHELGIRKAIVAPKNWAERLAQIEAEEKQEQGVYITDLLHWTCSCPSYLVSQFLMCKHLVRKVNEILKNGPLNSLIFFTNLRHQHYPPYCFIHGIHDEAVFEFTGDRIEAGTFLCATTHNCEDAAGSEGEVINGDESACTGYEKADRVTNGDSTGESMDVAEDDARSEFNQGQPDAEVVDAEGDHAEKRVSLCECWNLHCIVLTWVCVGILQ
jgi:hypothetical protein